MAWKGIINQTNNIFPKDPLTYLSDTYLTRRPSSFFHFLFLSLFFFFSLFLSFFLLKIKENGNEIEKTNLPEI